MKPGELTTTERLRVVGAAALQQCSMLPGTVLGPRRAVSSESWDLADQPDSPLCRDALTEARECLSPAVLAHSLRCWQYASLLSAVDRLSPDREALYVACMLHDCALGSEHSSTSGCFALLGAQRARTFVHERGGDSDTGWKVHEAIARHMDVWTPSQAEAALLHDAAYLDVSGRRVRDIEPRSLATIESHYPRDGFAVEFSSLVRNESYVRPKSTAGTLWRSGMRLAIASNPLERQFSGRRSSLPDV